MATNDRVLPQVSVKKNKEASIACYISPMANRKEEVSNTLLAGMQQD